ncbi:MAG: bifunctional precorrin-2 dehydrogenase/sirohydrochlorin ferrochelatase [Butyricicoccus sp.]|nr:bifunctional precorrin-2 dehydrogenase/sirohydrochlorin ferrochelatase [Butyricicoccus sp.]
MMGYFPLCVDLCGADVILIGEGAAARSKLEILLSFGAEVWLFSDSLADWANHPQIRLQTHSFEARDLETRPALVVAADTADAEWISGLCRDRGIPVNVVDVPSLCTFYFPSLINRGDLTVAVSTGGKSPAAAVYLRRKFEEQIPAHTEEILDWAQELRQMLRREHPEADRKRVMRQAVAQAMELDRPLTDDEVLAILRS